MQTISTPQVQINDVLYGIVPNSFKFVTGKGETNVRAASAGGNSIESVHSENAETKLSKVMFDLYVTADNISSTLGWKDAIGSNSIKAQQRQTTGDATTLSFDNMSMTNDPEFAASVDGIVSCEWSGDPMSAI